MTPVSSSTNVKPSKDPKERIFRMKNYEQIVIQGDEFSELRLNDDNFSANSQDQFWRRRLKEKYAGLNFLGHRGINNDLFEKIEQLYRQQFHQSIIPATHATNTKTEGLTNISFETIFLNLLKDHLNKIKKTFEQISVAMDTTTYKGTHFRSRIISALNSTDYASFKKHLEEAQGQDKEEICLLKRCMGFDKKADFPGILSQPYLKLQTIFVNCMKELTGFHESWKSICGPVQETELKVSEVDRIALSDVKRSLLGDSGRNLEITVNKEVPEHLTSYYQALISLIDKFVQLPHKEAERVEFAKSLMRNEEVGAKYFSRILRLCSINAWSHASKLIEKAKAGFREVPFITKFKDGMQCEVNVYSRNDYEVSQTKTLLVYKRPKPQDKDCLIAEGDPVVSVTFKAVFHVINDSCHLSLSIESWTINDQAQFQDKLLAYRILSSHAAGAKSV